MDQLLFAPSATRVLTPYAISREWESRRAVFWWLGLATRMCVSLHLLVPSLSEPWDEPCWVSGCLELCRQRESGTPSLRFTDGPSSCQAAFLRGGLSCMLTAWQLVWE